MKPRIMRAWRFFGLVQLLAWLASCGITWADPSLGGQQLSEPDARIATKCVIRFRVFDGKVVEVSLVSGPPVLGAAVERFVKTHWRLSPGTKNGIYTMPVMFIPNPPAKY
ncbi:MAG: hypothetical protein JO251_12605 [Verrucomicrobia bacterium]|nr:hypothetical protein [Verrucomicrobiota bacterium]